MAMGMSFMSLVLMTVLGGGGSNDLLSFIPTADYWEAKGVTVSAQAMIAELSAPAAATSVPASAPASAPSDNAESAPAAGLKAGDVRRLMAIRTLGELKAKEAVAPLKGLLASKDMFVADYAGKAIAAIEGKTAASQPAAGIAENMAKDLSLLPAGCGVVAQSTIRPGGQGFTLDSMLEQAMGEADEMPAEEKAKMMKQIRGQVVGGLLKMAEQTGNIRADGVTLGAASEVGPDSGFVVVIGRGLYDRKAVAEAMEKDFGPDSNAQVDGVRAIKFSKGSSLLFPSDEQMILVAGPPHSEETPVEEMVKAVKAGKGALADDANMAKLIKAADTKAPLWAAALISESYRQAELLTPLTSVTFSATPADGGLDLKLVAKGDDANTVKEAKENFEGMLKDFRENIEEAAKTSAAAKTLLEAIDTIKFNLDEKAATVTVTGRLKNAADLKSIPALLFMSHSVRSGSPAVHPTRRAGGEF